MKVEKIIKKETSNQTIKGWDKKKGKVNKRNLGKKIKKVKQKRFKLSDKKWQKKKTFPQPKGI